MEKSQKSALIIGATSGIGRALAVEFVNNGYKVFATGRRGELLDELKAEHSDAIITYKFDITERESVADHLNSIYTQAGSLDIVVLSSGAGRRNEDLNHDDEAISVDTNVCGFTAVTCWAIACFRAQGYGHFAAISSVAGIRGNRYAPAYSASKSYQMTYMEGITQYVRKCGAKISITDIRPGFVDTAMGNGPGAFWIAPVQKAAKQIYVALMRRRRVVYVTRRWRIVSLILRVIPAPLFKYL